METLLALVDLFLHLDKHLQEVVTNNGTLTYAILFLIIFCETGLVIFPILPGDSLLFAVGAIASLGALDIKLVLVSLTIAAILGDTLNYQIGKFIGPKVFQQQNSRIFKLEYLQKTQRFYDKYGGKTIIIARFVPIVRTFAPFLAGVGTMTYPKFLAYNVVGGILWICSLTLAGYFFGELPIVKNNFSLVVLGIIVVSILPVLIEWFRTRQETNASSEANASL